ncbi:S41 family peptidase [Actinoallomurus sp. NBC_01490]|uniref:S41 family peptidase n=1 Tax=Actinoallomurus sp. NBC_01490 TaxID=2903557 RepID=UPI002E32EE29|nr:S41 family peptidase [Actinoallomurus sp. NBC_01490]
MRTHGALAVAVALALIPGTAVAASPVDGIWRTDGYGTVIALDHGHLRSYETTAISCLPGFTADRTGEDGTYITDDGDTLTVRPGRMRFAGSPGVRLLRRMPALPASCGRTPARDPLTSFDVFWQTFAENYPFFAARGVDRQQVRHRYRPLVTPATTTSRLAEIFNEMIAPLNDAHTWVSTGGPPVPHLRPGTTLPSPAYDQRVKTYVERRDLHGTLTEYAQGRVSYADLPGDRGYLRISGFGGYTDADDQTSNAAELARALDAVFTPRRAGALRGLVIDVRINGGGSDSLGLQVASRLTGRPYLAYAKRARNDPRDPARFTTPQPIEVRPHAHPYRGPVAILTGGSTFSAGETFIQALMDRTPAPVRIGENTQGVFSDVMERSLPDGLVFGLPNEEFLTRTGRTFDGVGIPPDVRVPVFTDEEFARDRDSAFDRAMEFLSR